MQTSFYKLWRFALVYLALPWTAFAQEEYADVIIDSHYSGVTDGHEDFYGHLTDIDCDFITVSPDVCLGNDQSSFVSLPTGSYVTVGFIDNYIIDAPNQYDIFIDEVGASEELADVYISSDFGKTFTYFGEIDGGITNELDLHDIGYTEGVNAIRIEGKDDRGCVPGFDLVRVFGIEGANCENTATIAPDPIVCLDSQPFDLNVLVTTNTEGSWIGDGLVEGRSFIPNVVGERTFQYISTSEISICPNDTLVVSVAVAACDCNGIPNGTAALDECGICLEPSDPSFNQTCADCSGVPNGARELDECGSCLEPTDPNFNQSCADCAGTPNGIAELDECGTCLEANDPTFNQACSDCKGVPNGVAQTDQCGVCLEPSDATFNQSCLDCQGTLNGTAETDPCGLCLEPSDPAFGEACQLTQLIIPNTITPNGDFQNDLWVIGNLEEFVSNRIVLFDRSGNQLLEMINYQNNWDGTISGNPLPQGVYFYFIELPGRVKPERGSITIIR